MLTTAVILLDDSLGIVYLNPAAETLLGISEKQVLNLPIGELIQPSEQLIALCHRVLESGLSFRLRDLSVRTGHNGPLLLECRVNRIERERLVLLELNDTTIDTRLRQESELVAQQRLSRRILRQLAHEVKNPLGGMRGSAQLLARQLPREELRTYTKVIIDEADRLAAFVDNLLQTGGRLNPERLNIHEITEHVARLIEAEKPDAVNVLRDYDPSLPPLNGDRNQLIQAFLNLLRNAMQAVGERGSLILRTRAQHNLTLAGRHHRIALTVEVEDDGPGVPAELRETLFYPLVSGKADGSGLGLTIAQDLVSRHEGLIEVTSEPGQTIFRVRLPLSQDRATAGETAQ